MSCEQEVYGSFVSIKSNLPHQNLLEEASVRALDEGVNGERDKQSRRKLQLYEDS